MSGERTMRRMSQESGSRRRPERLVSGQIQREVMRLILDRKLRAGAPLPTETELMEDLGVSRNSVREALKALQALDIVDIRHGYGTYVGQASLMPLVDGLTFRTLARHDGDTAALAEILQVREVLEEGLVRRVVGTLTDAELDELEAFVDRAEAAEALRDAWRRAADERVEFVCGGGRGRTGTALACLAVLDGVPPEEAVAYVRRHYDRHAVETPWQRRYVRRFGT